LQPMQAKLRFVKTSSTLNLPRYQSIFNPQFFLLLASTELLFLPKFATAAKTVSN
jgi:hypothetical protein